MGEATPVIELRMAPDLVDIIRISLPSQAINRMLAFPLKVPKLLLNLQSDKMNSFVTVNWNFRFS